MTFYGFILWWPPIVAVVNLSLTVAIAVRCARQRRDVGRVLLVLSLGLQWTAKTQAAVVLAAMAMLVATSAPHLWASINTMHHVRIQWLTIPALILGTAF